VRDGTHLGDVSLGIQHSNANFLAGPFANMAGSAFETWKDDWSNPCSCRLTASRTVFEDLFDGEIFRMMVSCLSI